MRDLERLFDIKANEIVDQKAKLSRLYDEYIETFKLMEEKIK